MHPTKHQHCDLPMASRRQFLQTCSASAALVAAGASWARGDEFQVKRQLMPLITPGSVISSQAPQGWTHILVKSSPRCTQGDVRQVNQTHVRMASLFTTSLLAEVRRSKNNPNQFILNRVAGAVSKNIQGRDVAITPETHKQLNAGLGFLETILLKEFVKQQKTVTFVARGADMAIFDTPIVLRVGGANGANQEKTLRYATLVDPNSGRLDTFCWTLTLQGNRITGVEGAMNWLPPNHIFQCDLWVDKSEINFVGVPSNKAFACVSIPPGQFQIPLDKTPGAAELLSKPQFADQDCVQIRRWLRGIVNQNARQANRPR